ncbi:hypothetical protein PLEOSDRAFT_154730 [Pleurotus ostreatus PC15]|uniref:Uncharacterized protein n=1 Tax=Pleurotus ostreatus (strain PC15) TaxID=1137138 RepID=A0A067P0S8_PLEO1|nr:hypothetical protein PLEOSDRAFT_154730 [Pleurotus ostreatus PC15]
MSTQVRPSNTTWYAPQNLLVQTSNDAARTKRDPRGPTGTNTFLLRCIRKKAALNTGRRSRYKAEITRALDSATQDDTPLSDAHPVNVPGWMKLVAQIKAKFNSMTNGSTQRYVGSLFEKYTTDYQCNHFDDALVELRALHQTMRRSEAALLQLTGVGREYKVAETVGKLVVEGLNCVEEIACYASIGKGEVLELYEKRELLYQTLT